MFDRDKDGIMHVVGLSGGDDSTCLAFLLAELEPRPYNYVCTPTGNELPEMFAHWRLIGEKLGKRIYPIMHTTGLRGVIEAEGMLPNFRARFCTRKLKIEPYMAFLSEHATQGPIVSYVGLRADEPGRLGGIYDNIPGVTSRFPLREWGFDDPAVLRNLALRGIQIPRRTDCAWCYHQRLGEWYLLWQEYPGVYGEAEALEAQMGHTFRTPGRDSWPSSLREMREEFQRGRIPTVSLERMRRERMESGSCRVCAL